MIYKNSDILKMLLDMKKTKKFNPKIRGAEFIKNNDQFKILEYSPEDQSGILQSKKSTKLVIVYSFPFLGTLNWKSQNEYENEPTSIKHCLYEFRNNKNETNIME